MFIPEHLAYGIYSSFKKLSLFGVNGNQIEGGKEETIGPRSGGRRLVGKAREQYHDCSTGQRG